MEVFWEEKVIGVYGWLVSFVEFDIGRWGGGFEK